MFFFHFIMNKKKYHICLKNLSEFLIVLLKKPFLFILKENELLYAEPFWIK